MSSAPASPGWSRLGERLAPSAMTEVLRSADGGVISFVGGLPDVALFPHEEIEAAHATVLSRNWRQTLQYGSAAGAPELRAALAAHLAKRGIVATAEHVVITSGAQQAIDLLGRLFLDPDDDVVVTSPTYFAALEAFRMLNARILAVRCTAAGLDLGGLEAAFARPRAKLFYLITDHQNPTGWRIPADQRPIVTELAQRYGVLIIEDDVYGEMTFGQSFPPLQTYSPSQVAYVTSFSKTISAGLRVGALVAPAGIAARAAFARANLDICPPGPAQYVVTELITSGVFERILPTARAAYAERASVMRHELARWLSGQAQWTNPEGGFFVWLTLPRIHDMTDLLNRCVHRGVSFLPGYWFRPDDHHEISELRLSYSQLSVDDIRTGVRLFAECARAATGVLATEGAGA